MSVRPICYLGFVLLVLLTSALPQSIAIKVLNGRNGRPMPNANVNVWRTKDQIQATPLQTDQNGALSLHVEDRDADLRMQVGYASCQLSKPKYSWLFVATIPTREALERGIVTANLCGKATAQPQPGEVIVFVRPLTWWEQLNQ